LSSSYTFLLQTVLIPKVILKLKVIDLVFFSDNADKGKKIVNSFKMCLWDSWLNLKFFMNVYFVIIKVCRLKMHY